MPSMKSRSISPQPDVAVGHQRERGEEVLAELAVGDPRRALGSARSNDSVSMRIGRPRSELDVVGGRVAEREARLERERLGLEGQERGVPELPERPLVGVRDEVDRSGRMTAWAIPGSAARSIGATSWATSRPRSWSVVEQAARDEVVPIGRERAVDLAVEDAVAGKTNPHGSRNEPGSRWARSLSVTSGTGCAAGGRSGEAVGRRCRLALESLGRRGGPCGRSAPICWRKKNGTATTWRSRPG